VDRSHTGGPGAHTSVEDTAPPSPCELPPAVLLGTGATEWVALGSGDPVTLVHGGQGGWHVDVSGWMTGSAPEVAIAPTVRQTSTGLALAGDQDPTFVALAEYDPSVCEGVFIGNRAFLDDQPTNLAAICALEGEPLEVCVTVTQLVDGREALACGAAVAALDPVDQPACAAMRRSGPPPYSSSAPK
jgi:hypothetical protein